MVLYSLQGRHSCAEEDIAEKANPGLHGQSMKRTTENVAGLLAAWHMKGYVKKTWTVYWTSRVRAIGSEAEGFKLDWTRKGKGKLATLLATRSTTFGGKVLPLFLSIYMSGWDR